MGDEARAAVLLSEETIRDQGGLGVCGVGTIRAANGADRSLKPAGKGRGASADSGAGAGGEAVGRSVPAKPGTGDSGCTGGGNLPSSGGMAEELKHLVDLTGRIQAGGASTADIEDYRTRCKREGALGWTFGTLTSLKRQEAIKRLHASDLVKESLTASIAWLEKDLGADNATGAERMLIENVITSWFTLQIAEGKAEGALEGDYSIRVREFWCRRLDSAHIRFSRAVASLAQFRKVNIQIQINIAQQQVVAGIVRPGR